MSLWRRAQEILFRRRLDRETAEELSHHLDLLVARKMQAGLDEPAARREARLEIGAVWTTREQVAEERTGYTLEQMWRELSYAVRVLRRSPALTLLSVVTMSVGLGMSTVLFAMVNGIVLRPLAYPDSHQLVHIAGTHPEAGADRTGVSRGHIADWEEHTTAFDGVAGYYAMGRTVSAGPDGAQVVIAAQVTNDFFSLLRVPPLLGRGFTDDEYRRSQFSGASAPIGPDPVTVLSYGLWQRLGADPGVLGHTLLVDRRPFRIVGVMPSGFAMPEPGVELWIPWSLEGEVARDQFYLGAVARLKPEVSLAAGEDHLNAIVQALAADLPAAERGWRVRLSPLHTETVGASATLLWILFGAVGLLLLVACANVALLSLLRGIDRSQETAVRLALGASSGRLLRELVLESLLLAVTGGLLGLALAAALIALLPALPLPLPRLDEVELDWRAVSFTALVTLIAAMLSGVAQTWRRMRNPPVTALSGSSVRTTDSRQRHVLRDAIVVSQVVLAVVLMAGSGLLVRSFLQLRSAETGFDPSGVLVAPIFLDGQAYRTGDDARTYYRTLFERLRGIPGVVAVGGATAIPTGPLGPDFERPVWPEGRADDAATRMPAAVRMVTPDYFRVIGLPVVDGRSYDERETPTSPRVVILNETLARQLWPGTRAVGQHLVVDYSTAGTYPYEVIGVVGDVRFHGPRSAPQPEIYFPHIHRPYLIMNVVVGTNGDARAIAPLVRGVLREIDPQKPAQGLHLLEEYLGATYARDRQAMVTLLIFAVTAIGLAMMGVYGVLSQSVRERAREIGIRMAMGADGQTLMAWVLMMGLRLTAIGLAVGLPAAWLLTRALEGMLFGVRSADLVTASVVVLSLVVVGGLAAVLPSWRATRVDPVEVLRRA